jgi:hypothetical protein
MEKLTSGIALERNGTFSRAMAISAGSPVREHKLERQLKARRVYQSMGKGRVEAFDDRIREIAFDLETTAKEAANTVVDHFNKLIAEGYTADEVEAVLRHQNRERLTYFAYRDALRIWTRSGLPTRLTAL